MNSYFLFNSVLSVVVKHFSYKALWIASVYEMCTNKDFFFQLHPVSKEKKKKSLNVDMFKSFVVVVVVVYFKKS